MRVQLSSSATKLVSATREILAVWCKEVAFVFLRSNRSRTGNGAIILELGSSEMTLLQASPKGDLKLGKICMGSAAPERQLAALMEKTHLPKGKPAEVIVRLQPDQVLHRTLHLPMASLRYLRKAVPYELEKISPLDPSRVVFDMRLVKRDRVNKRVTVALRLIRRDLAEQILDQCRQVGLRIAALVILGNSAERPWTGFPIDRSAAARMFLRRWSTVFLAGLALVLSGLLITAQYLRGQAIERAILAETDLEQHRAGALRALRSEIQTTRAQISFFTNQRNAPLFVALLTDLSGLIPNSAWATEVDLTSDNVRVHGFAVSASDLIGIFEKSQRFSNARFRSPLVRGSGANSEGFDLSADIESIR